MVKFLSLLLLLLPSTKLADHDAPVFIAGTTMGTTWHITYFDHQQRNFKSSVDSLLIVLNRSINMYDPDSEVSRFNKGKGVAPELPYLLPLMKKADEIYEASSGAFDPTVMPLVNAWGFGPIKNLNVSAAKIDSLRALVGMNKVTVVGGSLEKKDPRIQLDFGGIGQGYGVDVVTTFLASKGIENMIVEIGGEGMAIGENLGKHSRWRIGILDPDSSLDDQFFKAYVSLKNRSFSTSGNYFNYRIIDGKKYGHTIDPISGYPVQHDLLSASVFAADCTTADAWATAFMVMGTEKSLETLEKHPELEVILMYTNAQGNVDIHISPSLKPFTELEL